MRKKRTIYFNDARHYYLFVFEPPMRMEDAWVPVDEVAGTAVDTFSYGVSRADGLFYPSKIGIRFTEDLETRERSHDWRSWYNMQSLIDQGLDPLTVLIDRAHEKEMEFIASLRMGAYGGIDPDHAAATGGKGFLEREVYVHQLDVLEELGTEYGVEGVELDFAASPGGSPFWLKAEDMAGNVGLMTEFVREASERIRKRQGVEVGARVYPTEELNLKTGLDVQTWLQEGLVDFVVPMLYRDFILDANMPIDWLVDAAHDVDSSVYAMLQPYRHDESRRFHQPENASPEMMRAAASNFWELDVDGLYTWFLPWPLGDTERSTLTELGDPDLIKEADKHYFLRRRCDDAEDYDYPAHLPLEIAEADPERSFEIPFRIADDPQDDRVQRILLRIAVTNLVSRDQFEVTLNGSPLQPGTCRRSSIRSRDPYAGQWLEYELNVSRPTGGPNLLTVCLHERPEGMGGGVVVEDVEIVVEYGSYPKTL